jgi:hypothetical protein
VVVSAALLTLAILQGALHALVLMVLAAMAYGVRDRRQPGRWLRLLGGLWPALLGVGLGIAALARFAVGGESPLWGALRSILIDLNATLLQRGHLGPPTGHKVHRLLAGTPRSEHFLATVQEQLGLPAVVLGLLLLAGVWTLVKAPSARPRAAGWLLLLLSGLCLYGLVANTEDFHSAQWFPPMALVASAGLLGWTRVLPGRMLRAGIPVCLTVGLWAALLWLPSLHPQPRDQLYGRLSLHAGMSRQWAALSDQAVGPVSAGGTLLVDDADVWAHRGFLLGRASLADLHRFHDGVGGVQHLEQPLVLLSGRGPSAVKQRLAGTWEYRPIDSFVDPRPLWLYLVVPHQIASSTPSTPSTTATP